MRDALIGFAIGLVLIYVGTRVSYGVWKWLLIGGGILFVGVMGAFVIRVVWEKGSPSVRRAVSRARGHVRKDPQLGELIRNVKAQAWEGAFQARDGTVEIVIDGTDEPNPQLVTRARELVADFATLESRIDAYLARTAKEWAATSPESAAEIAQLQVRAINVRSERREGFVVIDFRGPDVDRFWSCEYVGGKLRRLDFD